MSEGHNNPPAVVLELTQEEAEFLLHNCETNLVQGLQLISSPNMSEKSVRAIVDLMEQFKPIRDKLKKGLGQ